MRYTSIILLILILAGCSSLPEIIDKECATRYPILLVHGLGVRDDMLSLESWSHIPDTLRAHGATVYLSYQNAFDSHEQNARIIQKKILEILHENQCEKVNIIAHSKGGIESRYVISQLHMAPYVASLTTLHTPHRGSALAEAIMTEITSDEDSRVLLANLLGRTLGDENPDSYAAGSELTPEFMHSFNREVPDSELVYYQSFGGSISETYNFPWLKSSNKYIDEQEGPNDGVVSVESSKWGNFRGVNIGVSHLDIIGFTHVTGNKGFDYKNFYRQLVCDLSRRGF